MHSPKPPHLEAIALDVDGTLYDQAPVRRGMLQRLARHAACHPLQAPVLLKAIKSYRRAQEDLRGTESAGIAQAQLAAAAAASGRPVDELAVMVREWMQARPLDLVACAVRPGLRAFLQRARLSNLKLGVLSDYPAAEKLASMGILQTFDAVAWAQEPAVDRFKPDPAGLRVVAERLGVAPERMLYIGDRRDVDLLAAKAAGAPCVLIEDSDQPDGFRTFAELEDWLFGPA